MAEFFFVDTTPLVVSYWEHPENHHFDWRGVAPREAYVGKLLKVGEEGGALGEGVDQVG